MTPKQIADTRDALGLTQSQLAQLVGVHVLTVSKWERDVLSPTPHQVALLDAFARAAAKSDVAGPTAVNLLVTRGVAAALQHLLTVAVND